MISYGVGHRGEKVSIQQTTTQSILPWNLSSMVLQSNSISFGPIRLKNDTKWSKYSDISESAM